MTTILGIEYDWGCVMGADGATRGGDGRRYTGPGMEKLAKRGSCLLGAAGDGPYIDAFLTFTPPTTRTPGLDFMRGYFLTALHTHFAAFGIALNNDTDATRFHGIAALAGRLYVIDDAGGVSVDASGIHGTGTGAAYGIGALAAGATIPAALSIAISNDTGSGPPVQVLAQARSGHRIPAGVRALTSV